ncbi:hypothetical protein [Vibrio aerogenes]|nr:hypothetical protein [Vibrio aerogenes]
MALNADLLEQLIVENLDNAGFNTSNTHSQVTELADAIAKAIVLHIQENAVVIVDSVPYPVR